MSYFNPNHVKSTGTNKYRVDINASDNHGLITTLHFSTYANSKDQAIKTIKDKINSSSYDSSYLSGDHLTLEYKAREMINLWK